MFLAHNKRDELARLLKETFIGSRGVNMFLFIEGLKKNQLLSLANNEESSFYRAIKDYWQTDIGTYNSIFQITNGLDRKTEISEFTQRIKRILEEV
jgi:hypothetical protein